jgi:uncharacterized protein with GYD domain
LGLVGASPRTGSKDASSHNIVLRSQGGVKRKFTFAHELTARRGIESDIIIVEAKRYLSLRALGCQSPSWQLTTSAALKRPARRATMPGYIALFKYTQQGLADIKNGPERINQAKALAQKMGIRPIGTWVTMGPYDLVSIGEAPDDQTMAAFVRAAWGWPSSAAICP